MSTPSAGQSSRAESVRSNGSIFRRIPRGLPLTTAYPASDTNSTMSGIPGPGRLVGSMLSSAGRRFERMIDRFAEEQLGLGPNMAVQRLISALHEMHLSTNPQCLNDYTKRVDQSIYIADQLIWVCNGHCSQCQTAYLPSALVDLPESGLKDIVQLIKYIRPSETPSSLAIAATYLRILAESKVFSTYLITKLNLDGVVRNTLSSLCSQNMAHASSLDHILALKAAMEAFETPALSHNDIVLPGMKRFSVLQSERMDGVQVLHAYRNIIHATEQWGTKEIAFAQLLTWTLMTTHHQVLDSMDSVLLKELLDLIKDARGWISMSDYFIERSVPGYLSIAALYVSSASQMMTGRTHGARVRSLVFSPKATWTAASLDSGTSRVTVWDSNRQRWKSPLALELSGQVLSIAYSPNGYHLACGSDDGKVWLWDSEIDQVVHAFDCGNGELGMESVIFSPDGRYIASSSSDTIFRFWSASLDYPSQTAIFTGHTDQIASVAFSPDGHYIASGSNDKSVRLWDASTGVQMRIFRGHTNDVSSVAFSPGGTHIASGSADNTVRLWNADSSRKEVVYIGHTQCVRSTAFSPDGRYLASASEDQTVRLWNVEDAVQVGVLRGHAAWVSALAFAPDGKRIASGSGDKTIRLWDVGLLIMAYENCHKEKSESTWTKDAPGGVSNAMGEVKDEQLPYN